MAGVQGAMSSSLLPSASSTSTAKKLVPTSSSSASVYVSRPLKHNGRKNYLRPKLLKTLAKPHPTPTSHPQEDPQHSAIPSEFKNLETASDEIADECCSTVDARDVGESVITIEPGRNSVVMKDGGIRNFIGENPIIKIVLFVVGIYVFQAVCLAWKLSSVDFDQREAILEGKNRRRKANHLLNGQNKIFLEDDGLRQGDFIPVDASNSEEKIHQIRAMAREVRERERSDSQTDDEESSLGDFEDREFNNGDRSGIENEVDERLVKLTKRLKSGGVKSLLSYLWKSDKIGDKKQPDVAHVNESNGTKLMFEKKTKSLTIDSRPKPRGFQNLKDSKLISNSGKSLEEENNLTLPKALRKHGKKLTDQRETTDMEKEVGFQNTKPVIEKPLEEVNSGTVPKELQKHGKMFKDQRATTNMEKEKEKGSQNVKPMIGLVQDTSHEGNSTKGLMLNSSGQVEKQRAGSFTNDSQVNVEEFGHKAVDKEVVDKRSGIATDSWWLNLPYVLAIYVHRVFDSEESGGFFTLQIASSPPDHDVSHGVAFEDHGDANNFCFLLETFFEDLDGFRIDIIPLSKEELKEVLESHSMKMIVVKKRQVKFYAGQPLTEAETALRSLIELKQVVDLSQ